MKKITTVVLALMITASAFSQKTDSVIVKMSVQEFNMWNNFVVQKVNDTKDKVDAAMDILMRIRASMRSLDTSTSFINSRVTLLDTTKKK